MAELHRDEDGTLPSWAWPGGYPLFYLDKGGNVLCPECANREVDQSQAAVACDVNWEDPDLHCDDCGRRIESAYAEPEPPPAP
jgi:hypothetical protein